VTTSLRELQALFWQLLQAPEGVEARWAAMRDAGWTAHGDLSDCIAPSARMTPVEHLEIYSNMYFVRLRDCLEEDYPKLCEWIGPESFRRLVVDYLLAHPPSHFSLREVGRALPGFLSSHPLHGKDEQLAGLAALEWARVDVFDERDAEPVSRETLVAEAAADPDGFSVSLIPASRILPVAAGVLPLWRRLDTGVEAAPDASRAAEPAVVLVWRRDSSIRHRSLASDEARALEGLRSKPATVVRLAERVLAGSDLDASHDAGPQRFAEILDRWTHDGILVRASVESRPGLLD